VCKVNENAKMDLLEVTVLKLLQDKKLDGFPKLRSYGVRNNKPYIIMEKFGKTLENYFIANNS